MPSPPEIRRVSGAAIEPWLDDVARLRIAVFRDWPYLYEGDAAYERDYLAAYARSADSVFVLAIGDYVTPQILGGSKELLLPQAIMLQVGRTADFPLASAMSMVLMAVVTLAYLIFARHLRMDRL